MVNNPDHPTIRKPAIPVALPLLRSEPGRIMRHLPVLLMPKPESRPIGRKLLLGALLLVAVWVAFFDSHSLLRRAQWTYELHTKQAENERLSTELEQLQEQLKSVESPEVIERVAREQYGMRRPGETVYPVQAD